MPGDLIVLHHEDRLRQSLTALGTHRLTSKDVAVQLGWTRHETPFEKLDPFAQGMAAMETKAHLDLLVARGQAGRDASGEAVEYWAITD